MQSFEHIHEVIKSRKYFKSKNCVLELIKSKIIIAT